MWPEEDPQEIPVTLYLSFPPASPSSCKLGDHPHQVAIYRHSCLSEAISTAAITGLKGLETPATSGKAALSQLSTARVPEEMPPSLALY